MSESAKSNQEIGRLGLKNIFIVMLGTLGSRVSGLVRQVVFNTNFDKSVTDAFGVAYRIPNIFRELLAEGALINSFLPVYKSLSPEERVRLTSSFTAVLFGVNLLILGLGLIFAPFLVDLALSSSSSIDRDMAIEMTRLMMPFLMTISLAAVAMGLLNAHEQFRQTAFAPVAFNGMSIVLMLMFPHSATGLALSMTLGGVAQLLVQVPALLKMKIMPRWVALWHPSLSGVLQRMLPFSISTSSKQLLNFVLTNYLTAFPAGAVTGFYNAETLFQMALGLFAVSPALALYPKMADLSNARDWDGFRDLTEQALRLTLFIAAPVSVLLCVLAPYAVSIYNLKGSFDPSKFQYGWQILTTWSWAIVPAGMNAIFVRTFFVRGRTLEPLVITSLGALLDILLYALLTPKLGVFGFGVATTLSSSLVTFALMVYSTLQIKMRHGNLLRYLGQIVAVSIPAGLTAKAVSLLLPQAGTLVSGVVACFVAGGLGSAVYVFLCLALRIPEAQRMLARIQKR